MTTQEALRMAEEALGFAIDQLTRCNAMQERMPLFSALAAIRTAQDWQPMETAPRDGTRILLALPNSVRLGRWCENYEKWMDGYDLVELMPPRAWMPLPAPPAAPEEVIPGTLNALAKLTIRQNKETENAS